MSRVRRHVTFTQTRLMSVVVYELLSMVDYTFGLHASCLGSILSTAISAVCHTPTSVFTFQQAAEMGDIHSVNMRG